MARTPGRRDDMVRVVVADDHELYRRGIERGLAADGRVEVVATASSGAAALHAVLATRPNVALLDMQMPELTGVQVAEQLATAGMTIPVVLLTALASEDRPAARPPLVIAVLGKELPRATIADAVVRAARDTPR